MVFADRQDAARRLLPLLAHLEERRPVVAAVPRGAVPMAATIARALGADLDVVLVKKVGHPADPEVAVAAVDEAGRLFRLGFPGLREAQLAALARPEVARLRERRRAWSRIHPAADLQDRVVIVLDDGMATGATMVAAVRAARARGACHVVAAAPVASPEAMALVGHEADEVVCLDVPPGFGSVGEFYRDFAPVTDDEVVEALRPAPAAAG